MPHEVICPQCGQAIPLDPPIGKIDPVETPHAAHTVEMIVPGTYCGDELETVVGLPVAVMFASPPGSEDGPEFAIGNAPEPGLLDGESFEALRALPSNSGEFDPLAAPVADPIHDAFLAEPPSHPEEGANGSAEPTAIPGPASDLPATQAQPTPGPPDVRSTDDEEETERPPLILVLLGSYASAVTLALAWLIWSGYGRGATPRETLPIPTRIEPSKRLADLPALSKDRVTPLGATLRIGSLEFTPLEIRSGPAPLDGASSGEADCLILRTRLKNVSDKDSFAALDPAFVRPSDSGPPESLIAGGREPIESFALALASERSLVGQSFDEIKPGETVETILVSEPNAKTRLSPAMMWRIKLRVGLDETAVVGVSFGPSDVR